MAMHIHVLIKRTPGVGCAPVNPGADFTNGLKSGFGLKFKTLVLNSVKNVLSQQA